MVAYNLDGITYSNFTNIPGAVYTRIGVEYQQNAAGVLVPFDNDVPPISDGVGLGVWEARTNLLLQSQTFDNASWIKSFSTVTANQAVAPDGTMTADLVSNTPGSSSYIAQTSPTLLNSTTYVRTIYVSLAPGNTAPTFVSTVSKGAGGEASTYFNLSTLAITGTDASTSSIVPVGGGFYRIIHTFTTDASGTPLCGVFYLGAYGPTPGAANFYVWGAQLELGSTATPYIPTTSAAATRGAPTAYLNAPGLLVPPFTVQVWAQLPALDGVTRRLLDIDDGSSNNRVAILRSNFNNVSIFEWASGVFFTTDFTGKTGARLLKVAVRVRPTSYRAACDNALGLELSTSAMQQMNRIVFGNTLIGADAYLNGDITRFQIINRDVTDAELQALTL